MDFDDLLLNTVRMFDADEAILEKYRRRFQYIMVDEYQDTNRIQYRFIKMLAEQHHNLCVVG
jgi:DNA helicase II / ATP-dependent DNA helicase PcrA